jgi:hypothetical protein
VRGDLAGPGRAGEAGNTESLGSGSDFPITTLPRGIKCPAPGRMHFVNIEWVIGSRYIVARTVTSTYDPKVPRWGFGAMPPYDCVTMRRFTDAETAASAYHGQKWELGLHGTQFLLRDEIASRMVWFRPVQVTDAGSRNTWARTAAQHMRDRGVHVVNWPLNADESREFWSADSNDLVIEPVRRAQ